ncbi:MAG: membrane protein insertase YidC [Alphaproteobacteria bacterium]|nr:MAG: membrane protein insertase YidC [Alphaproteobacteria bacterium]
MSNNLNYQDKRMHKDDKKNMLIFFVACVGLFFLYDTFIYKPKMEELKEAQEQSLIDSKFAATHKNVAPVKNLSRGEALTTVSRVQIETETLSGSINLRGGRIDDLTLKNYATEPKGDEKVQLLNPVGAPYAYYGEFGWISQDQSLSLPSKTTQWKTRGGSLSPESDVDLQWNNGQGLSFGKNIAIDENYMFTVTQSVTNTSSNPITLYPFALIGRDGLPAEMTGAFILHEGPIGYVNDELQEIDYSDLDDGETTSLRATEGWIGITDKYWLTAIMPAKDTRGESKFRFIGEKISEDKTHYQTDMMGAAVTVQPGATISVPTQFFAGPKIVDMLEDYSDAYNIPHFDLAVDFGIFYFLTRPFYEILTFLYGVIGNFALALLTFTVFVKACVFPLAQKSYRSFARMRKVTPQMAELREKYGDDRVKLQAEIFALYKKENVNPMAGCFPLLIQIPIFFALYKVFYTTIDMRHEPFWGWISDMSAKDPTNLFELFGLIPWGAPSWIHIGAWPLIMGCTMAVQQRLNPPPTDPTQKFIMGIMPFWITVILAKFPAGLVVYWSWSNLLSCVQQYVLLRQEGVKVNIFTRTRSEKALDEAIKKKNTDAAAKAELNEVIDHDDIEAETKTVKPKTRKKKK